MSIDVNKSIIDIGTSHRDSITAEDGTTRLSLLYPNSDLTKGIFQTWVEVVDSIKDFKTPLFKSFNVFTEALDYARGILGPNYYITPALRHNPNQTPQYNIQKDTDKIIFCDHCTTMTDKVKRLNHTKEVLQIQNTHLLEKVTELELKLRQMQSSPSPSKMDETGVHSLLNAKKSIVPDVGTTSPVQTVAGKDKSNPLMVVTLPKSEAEEGSSSKTRPSFDTHKILFSITVNSVKTYNLHTICYSRPISINKITACAFWTSHLAGQGKPHRVYKPLVAILPPEQLGKTTPRILTLDGYPSSGIARQTTLGSKITIIPPE
ncbi:hypothetical protein RND71_009678 [Anisodus tanguticus]|uniref:Ribonuclease H1 N-terminal domain-containing protein n=1 Tax=Anisodus tanguticus TaxID=243964 RepID=A0AAE1SIW6_9SOLA|nr:hypothetical protein RND71_009678 [Anisodus tanguticus]